jgi:hypothetical protein
LERFLYFPNENAARAALKRAEEAGFSGEETRGAGDLNWLCFVDPERGGLSTRR